MSEKDKKIKEEAKTTGQAEKTEKPQKAPEAKKNPKEKTEPTKKQEKPKAAAEAKKGQKEDKGPEKDKEERKILRESIHTINLVSAHNKPRVKKARTAIELIRAYMKKHTRKENLKVSSMVNQAVWKNGINNPPRKMKIKIVEEENLATAELP